VADGADIIDVGGETAQPTSPVLEPGEEIARVVPVIEQLASQVDVPISVDTYKPEVARAAVQSGAALINDTSGLADERLADIAADTGCGIVCMHIPCHPKERLTPGYADPIKEVRRFLEEKTAIIEARGVRPEQIVVDPGVGFGKTPEENLTLIAGVRALRALGYALLFACSRRTFLGDLMGGQPPEDRLEPTLAVNAVAALEGADVLRVHDVRAVERMTRMLCLVQSHSGPTG
jgi:dihydropteroate synthase